MADVKYIDKETILAILEKYGITDQTVEEIYSDTPTSFVEHTKSLCNLYLKYLDLGTENALKASSALGAAIIFNLRKFITKKDVTLLIGFYAEEKKLQTVELSLTNIFNNLNNYSIDSESLKLSSSIKVYEGLIRNVNRQQSSVWKKMLDSSELTGSGDFSTSSVDGYVEDSKGKLHRAYRRTNIDRDVYYAYAGEKGERISKYYNLGGDRDFQFFNNGWLFEHFMTKWKNADLETRQAFIDSSQGEHPLESIVDKTDSIPGYKGGDFRWRGRDYQAKYGNDKIITISSIREVMQHIIQYLDSYEEGKRNAYRGIIRELTDPKNMDLTGTEAQINEKYDEIVEKMLKSLIQREK